VENSEEKTRGNSDPTPVVRGGAGTKAPPLAARPRMCGKLQQFCTKVYQGERNSNDNKDIL